MQHTVEDLSPVKKKIVVTVPANEVDVVLDRTAIQYRNRTALPGFRKGKAPLGMVEKRFSQDIYNDAVNELVNGNIGDILKDLAVEPLGGITLDETEAPLARGKDFSYSFTFDVMPQIDIPPYEGIGITEDAPEVTDEEIDDIINRVRKGMAERIPLDEKRLPHDGDIAVLDYSGFDENGEPIADVQGSDFQVAIGENQVIPDFEALVRTVEAGSSGEGKVTFPEDYGHKPLAGKTVIMKITVHSLMQSKLPEVNEEFAQKAGGFDTVAAMRENIHDTYMRNRKEMAKAKAQSLLLETLLKEIDFPLPEGMVTQYTDNILHGRFEELTRSGMDMTSVSEEDFEKIKAEAKTEAEQYAKTQLFLLAVAKREGLKATEQEMGAMLRQIATRNKQSLKDVQEHYARNNLFPALRDRILADKAMDLIYDKAGLENAGENSKENVPPKDTE